MTATDATPATLVSARGVSKRYGDVPVLEEIDFDIHQGITGLLGANGSGKTTLLGMILGLHPRDGGTLAVYGRDPWTGGAEVRALTGYAPEHHTLPPDLRADEFVRHVAELHGLPTTEAVTRASDALWLVGLGEERFRPMGTMSTGQRQRVKLAQAIAHDPRLILLDEPTDGLDPVQRDAMLELIHHVAESFEINVLLSSHLLDEVEQICDSAVIIGDGRTLASGTLQELRGESDTGLSLVLDGSDDQVAAVVDQLQERGAIVTFTGHHLNVDGSNIQAGANGAGSVFDHARDVCAAAEVGIVRLSRRRLSLEDVFLERLG
ncbi:MAG: ABC transporter ATP-binding protein [Acidimicrobiia bacterium]|nr:ABC transporter ATP-binding protein [Acidimicrobiia bacterium]